MNTLFTMNAQRLVHQVSRCHPLYRDRHRIMRTAIYFPDIQDGAGSSASAAAPNRGAARSDRICLTRVCPD